MLAGFQPSFANLLFNNGAYAEFIRIPERIVRKNLYEVPAHVSYQDAALIEPLVKHNRATIWVNTVALATTGIMENIHNGSSTWKNAGCARCRIAPRSTSPAN